MERVLTVWTDDTGDNGERSCQYVFGSISEINKVIEYLDYLGYTEEPGYHCHYCDILKGVRVNVPGVKTYKRLNAVDYDKLQGI